MADGDHVSLECFAGTGGRSKFLVGQDVPGGDVVGFHASAEEAVECGELGLGWRLFFKVSHAHDAEVPGIIKFDVGSLIVDGSAFVDSPGAIDDVVVADIPPASVEVSASNVVESSLRGGLAGGVEGGHAVVVNGDAFDGSHFVHA